MNRIHDPEKSRKELVNIVKDTYCNLKSVATTTYGRVALEGDYGIYKIGEHGQRLIPEAFQNINAKKRLLILGSSQTFGFLSPDNESFAVKLAELLPDYKIDNFSGIPQDTHQSLMNWIKVNDLGYNYDTVVILAGPFDYFNYITETRLTHRNSTSQLASYRVIKKIIGLIISTKNQANDKYQILPEILPVQGIVSDYNSLIQYGKERNTRTYIIAPPTPYGNNADVDYLEKDILHSVQRTLNESIMTLSEKIRNIPQVTDLTHLFDDKAPMFIDTEGHLNKQGNMTLAKAVAEIINTDYQ